MTTQPLTASLVKADIPRPVLAVVSRLRERGFQAFLVGGCVRDLVLGHRPKDYDVATDALPDQVERIFPRVIPTGKQHGTVTVLSQGTPVEVTTFRTEGEYLDARRPSRVEFRTRIEEDLSRRDFTINAMAFDPVDGKLCDPFGGQADLRARKINYTAISKPNPANNPDKVVLKGVPPENRSDLLSIVQDRLPEYNLTSGADNTWMVSMKPQALADLKNRAVAQAIETIRNRIDQLGVSEPIIEEHGLGQYQILVQLPGVDDPARVKEIMQSTAMLEIRQSFGGPYPSEQAALQDKGGVLPPDQVLMPGRSAPRGASSARAASIVVWALVIRALYARDPPRPATPATASAPEYTPRSRRWSPWSGALRAALSRSSRPSRGRSRRRRSQLLSGWPLYSVSLCPRSDVGHPRWRRGRKDWLLIVGAYTILARSATYLHCQVYPAHWLSYSQPDRRW